MAFEFKNKGFSKYTYAQLLDTENWLNKRNEKLILDDFACTSCFRQATETFTIDGRYFAVCGNMLKIVNGLPELLPEILFYENPTILHVHHKYYMLSRLPWEYDKEDLITLCIDCHQKLHQTTQVPVYFNERKIALENLTDCPRCNGNGYILEFDHIQGGICFKCRGAKYLELTEAHYNTD